MPPVTVLQHPPSKEDYEALGVTGVTDANLDAINALIAGKGADEVDSKAEVQEIVAGYIPTPADTTKPVITLIGEATVTLTVGEVYIEAGATATDDRDGDITTSITIHDPVDTAIAGTYTVTYDVNDSAGNAAETVSRTVTVQTPPPVPDTTKPVITLNGAVEVNLTVGEVYIEAGATATDDRDGNITASITIHNPVDTATAGTYTVTYDVNDSAGNAADTVSRTVTVQTPPPVPDTTKPVITLNGTVEVNLTVGEVYIEAGATATDDRDGNITASITIHDPVDTAIAGTYTVTYDVNDSAGNAADTVSRTVHIAIAPTIATQEQTYAPRDTVSVTIGGTLSDDRDWVGVYPAAASNDWGNVIAWNWVSSGENILNKDMKGMPAGEYEVRLFFHNATDVAKAKAGFSVEYAYGAKGPYFNEIDINDTDEDYIIYRPKNHTENAPVMLFFGMSYAVGNSDAEHNKTSLRHEGLMKYLASLGCYVIGNKKRTTGWTDATKWPSYTRALIEANDKGADTDKLGIIGHSAGAMASYWWMKKYKEDGYGQTKSFIIDLHGYDASKMTKDNLLALTEVDSLIIMYGGLDGNASETTHYGAGFSDFSEDPRVLLTVSHLLPDTVKKGFIALETKDHMYSYGEWEEQIINGDTYNAVKSKKTSSHPSTRWSSMNGLMKMVYTIMRQGSFLRAISKQSIVLKVLRRDF